MPNRMCPHCRTLRNMRVGIIEKVVDKPNGIKERIKIRNYYCSVCNIFVSSETT